MGFKTLTLCIFLIICIDKNSVMSLWDFAATTPNKIIFFDNNWNELSTSAHRFERLSGLAFDETEEKLYFSDRSHISGSIFAIKLSNSNNNQLSGDIESETKIEIIVPRLNNETIGGISYDPYDRYLYWTDKTNKKIYRLFTSFSSATDTEPEVFLNLSSNAWPESVTIDICNRMLYWTNGNSKSPSIESVSLRDDAKRESKILFNTNLTDPRGIYVDQYLKRIFWVDNLSGVHYAVESANLNGTDRKVVHRGLEKEPVYLTVSKDSIYMTDDINEAVWNISKSGLPNEDAKKVYRFSKKPTGLVSRFGLLTKLENVPECREAIAVIKERLNEHINISSILESNATETAKSINLAKPHVFCLHNGEYNPLSDACTCKIGFSGLRCETNDCTNFCVHGTCELSTMGFPECICNEGFYGIRCEAFKCTNYCLNGGFCAISDNKPKCECSKSFSGDKCEQNLTETCTLFCTIYKYNPNYEIPINCRSTCKQLNESNNTASVLDEISKNLVKNIHRDYVQTPVEMQEHEHGINNNLDNFNHINTCNSTYTIIIICLSVLLAFTIVLLITFTIRRTFKPPRPKIRKTFVVQKRINGNYKNQNNICNNGVVSGNTPLTSRPLSAVEKCEITIEDCCNMNICDTPCFDPTVLQQSFESCSKSEDKQTLVNNMEEDLY